MSTQTGGPVSGEEGPVRHDISDFDQITCFDRPALISAYRLQTVIRYAEGRARGIHMTDPRKARSVQLANLREVYGISARRWEQAAAELRQKLDDWKLNGVPDGFLIGR